MAIDPITATKFASGLLKPKTHLKTLAYVIIIAFWLFVGYGMYKAYFMKIDTTTEHIEQKIEYNYNNPDDAFFVGVKIFGFKLGISRVGRVPIQETEIIKK